MQRESIHRKRIFNRLQAIIASLKVLGSYRLLLQRRVNLWWLVLIGVREVFSSNGSRCHSSLTFGGIRGSILIARLIQHYLVC